MSNLASISFLLLAVATSACTDESSVAELPLVGADNAPVVTDLYFKCNPHSQGVTLSTSALMGDPQGVADVTAVTVEVLSDDASDVLETLRLAVCNSCVGRNFYDTIDPGELKSAITSKVCAAQEWPVNVIASDQAGHQTKGHLRIRVTR